jgi:hypothetical protein
MRCGRQTLVIKQAVCRLWKQNWIKLHRNSRVPANDFWLRSQSMVHCCPQKPESSQVSINCIHLLAWGCCHFRDIIKEVTVSTVVIFLNIFCVLKSLSVQVGLNFWSMKWVGDTCWQQKGGGSSLTVNFLGINCLAEWWARVLWWWRNDLLMQS